MNYRTYSDQPLDLSCKKRVYEDISPPTVRKNRKQDLNHLRTDPDEPIFRVYTVTSQGTQTIGQRPGTRIVRVPFCPFTARPDSKCYNSHWRLDKGQELGKCYLTLPRETTGTTATLEDYPVNRRACLEPAHQPSPSGEGGGLPGHSLSWKWSSLPSLSSP